MTPRTSNDWFHTETQKPNKGDVVQTMDSGGRVQDLLYDGPLWFFPDGSMHVYYTPTFWKPIEK